MARRDFLICVDSDGCVMDTMNIKHKKCFGPCIIEEWGLESRREKILKRWNEINLFSMTRGVNRFRGLAMMLEEINRDYETIEGLDEFRRWVDKTDELSNAALKKAVDEGGGICLEKALSWSEWVNRYADMLSDNEKKPFCGAREALETAHNCADTAIVSSANRSAVDSEWSKNGLIACVDLVFSQEDGSKSAALEKLLGKGYLPERVLMVGDAPGDLTAAEENGVLFYPILAENEEGSWKRFKDEACAKFICGAYSGQYQRKLIDEFKYNLACS